MSDENPEVGAPIEVPVETETPAEEVTSPVIV